MRCAVADVDYTKYLPAEPPEGLVSWLLGKGLMSKEYLIYKADWTYEPLEDRKVPAVRVVCTACNNEFVADKVPVEGCHNSYAPAPFGWRIPTTGEAVIAGSHTMCPICGQEAEVVHVGQYGTGAGLTQKAWTAVVSRLEVPGHRPRLLLTDWLTQRFISKQGETRFRNHLYSAYVVEEKKIVRIMGYQKMFSTITLCGPRQRKTFLDSFGRAENIWPFDPLVLEGTTAENCKLDKFVELGGVRLVGYLGLFVKRPQVENLVMQGAGKLVDELLNAELLTYSYQRASGYAKLEDIRWKEKKPCKMLGMTKEQFRTFKERGWGKAEYKALCWASAEGLEVPWPEGAELLTEAGSYKAAAVLKDGHREVFWKILRYLHRQGRDYYVLRDYWNMAGNLEMDLDDQQVRWPKDLGKAHDRALERFNQKKNAAADLLIGKRAESLSWLCWEKDGITIRPCASKTELQREGKLLHHCVASYADRYANGDTAILLIRKAEEPDKPWFTLELDEKELRVRQNRGLRNCARTPEVEAFEEAWLKRIKKLKQKKKEKTAA